ncbi:RimJ/RimL family protein N-acetyltransferase [Rhodoglobus vestalii]|uniref:RimJ/RimL family protein N-acetyltransferase n=1 Tax=Rhodoglobus vestalii TaxID=193384 RepID=A0A8H2PUW3_9MICO|nr:GNAT family protein [Rhodoglobus vestalii]TQO20167.1 RimJ/RimL family protein N-acetyltransferase [Rhodoglobus vestalii]
MTVTRPEPGTFTGTHVVLEPLMEAHLAELWPAIGVPEVFAGGYGGGSGGLPSDAESFVEWMRGSYLGHADRFPFAVRLVGGVEAGRLVGVSTLGDLDDTNAGLQLGWTAYDPRVWGTAVNPETKLLLLGFAFDSGYVRVKIQADAINARSRAAILKLGATFEGIQRKHRIRADGSWRDTAVYSILDTEWPAIRAGLLERLGQEPRS